MGQKVHPIGFRIGVNKDWQAHWFSRDKDIAKFLLEDQKIREYIVKRFPNAQISKILIDRASEKLTVTIHTAKPGVIIGKQGKEIENLRNELAKLLNRKFVGINVLEIRTPELDAQVVAETIAKRIEQRANHRRVMKRAVEIALKMGAKGVKVQAKGRLAGAEMARKEWYIKGRVPLQTIRADIDYGFATAYTKYGTIGVKVWIYKGDKLERITEEVI
ncbi:MAG: 30S ribosomal protein S3 [candidate division WOR-3 bacterium]|nr:30S ribosomal protein S3 [candidate division WOR-3 bacterium]MCX7947942.1 30S ribosomal protein S3 [candidate division WOR-3 bacterium]MDW8150886.1 30S ribosomal protein S3 [candidate division WOR-3 bacterium]